MTTQRAFIDALKANITDWATWAVFADWLDDKGNPKMARAARWISVRKPDITRCLKGFTIRFEWCELVAFFYESRPTVASLLRAVIERLEGMEAYISTTE